jgi:hypothetical protein
MGTESVTAPPEGEDAWPTRYKPDGGGVAGIFHDDSRVQYLTLAVQLAVAFTEAVEATTWKATVSHGLLAWRVLPT